MYMGTRRKNSTGARPHPYTREQGGRTVQELDLTPVQGNKEEEQYRSQTSPLYKGTRMKNSTGARPHPYTREQGRRTVNELDLTPVQGNKDEEQYRS